MTKAILRYLGETIRQSRIENGITAEALAERAGVSCATLADIESGGTEVEVGIVIEVALVARVNLFEAQQITLSQIAEEERRLRMFPKKPYVNKDPVFDDF